LKGANVYLSYKVTRKSESASSRDDIRCKANLHRLIVRYSYRVHELNFSCSASSVASRRKCRTHHILFDEATHTNDYLRSTRLGYRTRPESIEGMSSHACIELLVAHTTLELDAGINRQLVPNPSGHAQTILKCHIRPGAIESQSYSVSFSLSSQK
jgi:hypothetical protein